MRTPKKRDVLLAFLLLFQGYVFYGQNDFSIDSLEKILSTPIQDSTRIGILQKISFKTAASNPNKAIEYARQGIRLAQQYADLKAEANCRNNIGSSYQAKGEYENAMNAYMKALKIHEQLNNDFGCATEYSNMGFIFRQQQNYAKAIEFHRKALHLYKKINDDDDAAGCLVNIGNVYYNKGDYDSAIVQYQDALKVYQRLGEREAIATIENNIGAIYFEKQDYETANEYFLKSYVIREQSQNKYEMATSLNNIGEVFGKLGNYQKAIEFCMKSLKVAGEIDAKDIMVYNYENLAGLNASIGKFDEAYHYQQLCSTIKDSILSVENNKQINELSVKYETDKKEKENQILKQQNDLQNLSINRQKIINYSVTVGLILVLGLAFFIFRGYKEKQRANLQLKEKNMLIQEKNKIVEEKNKDITDSIRYAKRLQTAILKPEDTITNYFDDGFVLFRPKDIVSGDFYWFEKFGNLSLVAAADCTGHGVPGAFMSIIGCNLLSQAVNEYAITQPAAILNSINKGLTKVLQQKSDAHSVTDGMDIALCSFNPDKMVVEFSGAYNPLWLIRDEKLMDFAADKFPVGAFVDNHVRKFASHEIPVKKGDMIYVFSDGYADQFGGPSGKKFKYKQLQDTLLEICKRPGNEQRMILNRVLENWMGRLDQIDDVLIIGIRI